MSEMTFLSELMTTRSASGIEHAGTQQEMISGTIWVNIAAWMHSFFCIFQEIMIRSMKYYSLLRCYFSDCVNTKIRIDILGKFHFSIWKCKANHHFSWIFLLLPQEIPLTRLLLLKIIMTLQTHQHCRFFCICHLSPTPRNFILCWL